MLFSSVNQIAETLAMIYCGIVLGIVYDLFGLLRKFARKKSWLVHVLDLLFCVVAFVISCLFIYFANRGNLKLYILIGILLGILLQFLGIKPIIKLLVDFIFNLLKAMRRKFKNSALYKRIIK